LYEADQTTVWSVGFPPAVFAALRSIVSPAANATVFVASEHVVAPNVIEHVTPVATWFFITVYVYVTVAWNAGDTRTRRFDSVPAKVTGEAAAASVWVLSPLPNGA
jgi:multidrug efflux pump subunit AcrA (membrane-fusion protein)